MINFIKIFLLALILQVTLFARDINLNKFLDTANETNQHLFLWFHKNNCTYCENMHEFTLDDDKVKSLIKKKFIYIHINVSQNDKVVYKEFVGNGREFAMNLGFDFYPTSLFFDNKGEIIYNATGYRDAVSFHKILKYIETNSYEQMDYETFENDFDFYKDE